MAQFIGIAGDFQKEKAINRRLNALMGFFMVFAAIVFVFGYIAGKTTLLWAFAALAVAIPALWIMERQVDKQIRRARNEDNGAAGEREIIPFLTSLPDTFTVVSDLDFADSFGNIDQLVIGPTGVFAIDVKNWRGTVTADGKGELLQNGKPTDKALVRTFTRRVMDLKERLKALTKLDPYIQCVFVFTHTQVEANWGTTGAVHCICIEKVVDYINKYRCSKPLPATDILRLVAAAKALKESIAGQGMNKPTEATRI